MEMTSDLSPLLVQIPMSTPLLFPVQIVDALVYRLTYKLLEIQQDLLFIQIVNVGHMSS